MIRLLSFATAVMLPAGVRSHIQAQKFETADVARNGAHPKMRAGAPGHPRG